MSQCQKPGCTEEKAPGSGIRYCQEHRAEYKTRRASGACEWPECTTPKPRGRGHKYCTEHIAAARERRRAQGLTSLRAHGVEHKQRLKTERAQRRAARPVVKREGTVPREVMNAWGCAHPNSIIRRKYPTKRALRAAYA